MGSWRGTRHTMPNLLGFSNETLGILVAEGVGKLPKVKVEGLKKIVPSCVGDDFYVVVRIYIV